MSSKNSKELWVENGICFAMFAYDVGLSINLDMADKHFSAIKERSRMKRQRRAPQHFDYHPAPLRLTQSGTPITIGEF